MKVDLRDVIEAIEFENELLTHYYNKKTGIIIYKEDKSTREVDKDNIESYEPWKRELIMELKDLEENPEDYIKLPGYEELNEGKMMKKFMAENSLKCNESEEEIEKLKKVIESKGLLSEWYDFREDLEKSIAVSWCEENNIIY